MRRTTETIAFFSVFFASPDVYFAVTCSYVVLSVKLIDTIFDEKSDLIFSIFQLMKIFRRIIQIFVEFIVCWLFIHLLFISTGQ